MINRASLFTFLLILCAKFGFSQIGNSYTVLKNLYYGTDGSAPMRSPVFDGTYFYFINYGGGFHNKGSLVKIKPDGSDFSKLIDFDGVVTGGPFEGSLFFDGTYLNFKNSKNFYKVKPDGFGFSNWYTFPESTDQFITYDANYYYGYNLNPSTYGSLYKLKSDTSENLCLHTFLGGTGGEMPKGSLCVIGNVIYGVTYKGGDNDLGLIYKVNSDSTGFTKLFDFTQLSGKLPYEGVISDSTFLYGITEQGGVYNLGVVYKIKMDGTGYVKLKDLDVASGVYPQGKLMLASNTLYGMTRQGGLYNQGTIFKYDLLVDSFSVIKDLEVSIGGLPLGTLVLQGGEVYGLARSGGQFGNGVFFKIGNPTGIQEPNKISQCSIFPNPFSSTISISLPIRELSSAQTSLCLYTPTGQRVMNEKLVLPSSTYSTDHLSAGFYFWKVLANDGRVIDAGNLVKQ